MPSSGVCMCPNAGHCVRHSDARMSIAYRTDGSIAQIELDSAATRNALEPADWQELDRCVAAASADDNVRVVVVSGRHGTFCSGGNLKTMPARLALPYEIRRRALLDDAGVILRLRALEKPTLAMLEGSVVGAGLSLALACDVRLAADTTQFSASFHRVGLTTDFGLAWLLTHSAGPTRALDLLFRAAPFSAARALELGLVTAVHEPAALAEATQAYASMLAAAPPLALAATKRSIYASTTASLSEALALEADAQAKCSRSDDAREGVNAFLEKRPPSFLGR